MITFANVFPILAEAWPEFTASAPDRVEDRLSYPFLNDMVRFVCDRVYPEFDPLLHRFAALLENLLADGDSDVRDLVHDALETLRSHEEREKIADHFGHRTRDLWKQVCGI